LPWATGPKFFNPNGIESFSPGLARCREGLPWVTSANRKYPEGVPPEPTPGINSARQKDSIASGFHFFNPNGIESFSPGLARCREGLPWVTFAKRTYPDVIAAKRFRVFGERCPDFEYKCKGPLLRGLSDFQLSAQSQPGLKNASAKGFPALKLAAVWGLERVLCNAAARAEKRAWKGVAAAFRAGLMQCMARFILAA
jgi:hypothetical protein